MFHSYYAENLQPERFRAVREQIGDGPQGLNPVATIPAMMMMAETANNRLWISRPNAASVGALVRRRRSYRSMTGTVLPDKKLILTSQIEKAQPFC